MGLFSQCFPLPSGRGWGTGRQDLNAIEARGQVLAVPQHLQFIGAGGIAAPGLRERERTLRPLPFWRLSSLSLLIASACALQMMRDEWDQPLACWARHGSWGRTLPLCQRQLQAGSSVPCASLPLTSPRSWVRPKVLPESECFSPGKQGLGTCSSGVT